MGDNIQMSSRPRLVTVAVLLLTLGITIHTFEFFWGVSPERFTDLLVTAALIGTPYVIIWLIFAGKNWARWVFLVLFGVSLGGLPGRFQFFLALPIQRKVIWASPVIFCLLGAVALLSRVAVDWFGGKQLSPDQDAKNSSQGHRRLHVLPSNSNEWATALLRPFKIYTIVGMVIFQIVADFRRHTGASEIAKLLLLLYLVSVPVLILGGLIQLRFKPRKAALYTFLFALGDIIIVITLLPYLAAA